MEQVTLEQINKNIIKLQIEIEELKGYISEDFELAEDVKKEIEESRKLPESKFLKHKDVMKEFS